MTDAEFAILIADIRKVIADKRYDGVTLRRHEAEELIRRALKGQS